MEFCCIEFDKMVGFKTIQKDHSWLKEKGWGIKINADVSNTTMTSDHPWDVTMMVKINYCPFCGKHLKDEESLLSADKG